MPNFSHENTYKHSICNGCNSKSYCRNAASGVMGCENFNKFPKPSQDEARSYNR